MRADRDEKIKNFMSVSFIYQANLIRKSLFSIIELQSTKLRNIIGKTSLVGSIRQINNNYSVKFHKFILSGFMKVFSARRLRILMLIIGMLIVDYNC